MLGNGGGDRRAGKAAKASQGAPGKDPKEMSREELTATIKALDAELFGAYNRCELEKFGSFFPEQLEFYHDNGGLVATTREQLCRQSSRTSVARCIASW